MLKYLLWAGPAMTMMSVLGVHAANAVMRPAAYVEAPPSISRAIVDPAIGEPFAAAMVFTAAAILAGVVVVFLIHARCWRSSGQNAPIRLHVFLVAELVAVAGILILSQYRTPEWQLWHNAGSYMLFFGHAIGVLIAGHLARDFAQKPGQVTPAAGTHNEVPAALPPGFGNLPHYANTIFASALLFGLLYFGGRFAPDSWFFWQRLALAVWEIVVLGMFVGFLAFHSSLLLPGSSGLQTIPLNNQQTPQR
jgi:hypothetical protein